MQPKLQVSHTGITVSSIERWRALFVGKLEFEMSETKQVSGEFIEKVTGVDGAVVNIAYLDLRDHQIELLEFVSPAKSEKSNLRPNQPGFKHFSFHVEDIETAIGQLSKGGFNPINPSQSVPDGPRQGVRVVYLRDEDNVVLELQQAPGGT
jgi:catechol 2,3-dioxygenase-like lactoylglutathione lyase family enzyme